MMRLTLPAASAVLLFMAMETSVAQWASWRGPDQNGSSREWDLPESVAIEGEGTWTYDLAGRGTPVVANGLVYAMGYEGERENLQEVLVCLDEATGERVWEHRFTDFLTDIIYYRFAIGSPTVDVETGRVYALSTAGLLSCFESGGTLVWQRSLMSEYGRLTFPNGRTGGPIVLGDTVIVHVITSGWGSQAPARDRFYAFQKGSGESVWTSTPGGPPKDSSFSYPVVAQEKGRTVLYAGLGGGHVVCLDGLTGEPLWRFRLAVGGLSSSPLVLEDRVIATHGKENVDSSAIGRMVALRRGAIPEPGAGPLVLDYDSELWRNDLVSFTSSPTLLGRRIYQTDLTGELCCVDADDGRVVWKEKLGPSQLHASPASGDGKLYVPLNNGTFSIIRPTDDGAEMLCQVQLEGNCLGAPAIANGRVLVHTTTRLYSFGAPGTPRSDERRLAAIRVVPADLTTTPGSLVRYRIEGLDARGRHVPLPSNDVTWSAIPAGAAWAGNSRNLIISKEAPPSAMVLVATHGDLTASARLRVVAIPPHTLTFDDVELRPHPKDPSLRVGPPPSHWVGAKLKWEVMDVDGEKVLAKTLEAERALFQRTMTMTGHPSMSDYTLQADVRSDGNRRSMSTVGLVNQRYLIRLKGNHQELEVSSTMELLRVAVPYKWKYRTWHTVKTRVDPRPEGGVIVRAKAWPRGEAEPDGWMLEVPHANGHTHGSPGIYGFALQNRFRVYLDNIKVTQND